MNTLRIGDKVRIVPASGHYWRPPIIRDKIKKILVVHALVPRGVLLNTLNGERINWEFSPDAIELVKPEQEIPT